MKRAYTYVLILVVCLSGAVLFARNEQQMTPQGLPNPLKQKSLFVFAKIEPALRRQSQVPPRLPGFLPGVDEKHPIYAVAKSVTKSSYDVLLAVALPCEGQNNCLCGSVSGSTSAFEPDEDEDAPPKPVRLQGGIEGQFVESVCHTYCNEAHVRWSENGFYYSIGIKAEKMDVMIQVANSAIQSQKAGGPDDFAGSFFSGKFIREHKPKCQSGSQPRGGCPALGL